MSDGLVDRHPFRRLDAKTSLDEIQEMEGPLVLLGSEQADELGIDLFLGRLHTGFELRAGQIWDPVLSAEEVKHDHTKRPHVRSWRLHASVELDFSVEIISISKIRLDSDEQG